MKPNLYLWNVDTEAGWSDPANWVNADAHNAPETIAPTSTAAVEIEQGAADTGVTALTVGALTQTGATATTTIDGEGDLVVSGAASFEGAVAQTGSGTTQLKGATSFDAAAMTLTGGRTLENLGTFTFQGSGGAVDLGDTISGGTFENAAGARLNLDAGASFSDLNHNQGAVSFVNDGAIALGGGAASIGVNFTDQGQASISVAAGATLDFSPTASDAFQGSIAGAGSVNFGATAGKSGAIVFESGLKVSVAQMAVDNAAVVTVDDALAYAGQLTLGGGTFVAGAGQTVTLAQAVAGSSGSLAIDAGATLVLGGAVAKGVNVDFEHNAAELKLGSPGAFQGTLEHMAAGGSLFQQGVTATKAVFSAKDDDLVVSNNGQVVATIGMSDPNAGWVVSTSAQSGGTLLVFEPVTLSMDDALKTYIPCSNGYIVADTAANLGANLANLKSWTYGISTLRILDNQPVPLTLAQLQTASGNVHKLATASGAPYELALSGTAAQLGDDLVTLNTLGVGHIQSIAITGGGPLSLSVAQWQANEAIYDRLAGGVEITDTSANILADLRAIVAGVNIVGVAPTGGGAGALAPSGSGASLSNALGTLELEAPLISTIKDVSTTPLAVSALQFASDAAALAKLVNANGAAQRLKVSGTAAQISAELDALNADAQVVGLTASGGGKVAVSVAQLASDAAAITKLESGGAHIELQDSLADLAAAASSVFARKDIGSVIVADSFADISNMSAAVRTPFASKFGGFVIRDTVANEEADVSLIASIKGLVGVEIVDSAAAIAQGLTQPAPKGAPVLSITSNSGVVNAGIDDLLNASTLLDAISGGFDLTLTADQLTSHLALIHAQASHIDAISLLTGPLSASLTTFLTDESAFDRIAGGVSLAGDGGTVASHLANLQADAQHILGVSLTSGAVAVSAAIFEADTAALNLIAQGYSLTGDGASVTADFLDLAANDDHINAVTISGKGTQTLDITGAEQLDDAVLLSHTYGAYVLNVSSAGAATTTGDAGGLTLVDTQTAGDDILTGGGAGDTFVLKQGFGRATITDFAGHLSGAPGAQDHIVLSKAEFASAVGLSAFQVLLNHAVQIGANVVITAGADTLTLEDVAVNSSSTTLGRPLLKTLAANFTFV